MLFRSSEFETDSYSAEFGRATGAVVNATTKSGSNQIHGVVYEFLRNQAFDARNYFDQTLPPYHQNQFGATIGLPIIHDKLFLFADYEGLRLSQGQTNTALVPTAQQRAGDFSSQLDLTSATGVTDCNGHATYNGELFDTKQTQASTASPTGYCGVPFGYNADGTPSNVIPVTSMDSLGAKLAALYPLPNANGSGYNYVSNPNLLRTANQGDIRVDQVLTHRDNIFYRFSMSRAPSTIPATFPGLCRWRWLLQREWETIAPTQSLLARRMYFLQHVSMRSASVTTGFIRIDSSSSLSTNVSGTVGFPGVPYQDGTDNGGLPQMVLQ